MKVENGKIVQATESELFLIYLRREYDNIMSFPEYKRRCIEQGTKVVGEEVFE